MRSDLGLAFDSDRNKVVLFGGERTGSVQIGDTWEYDGVTATWTQRSTPSGPIARSNVAMAYDPVRRETVLFGGKTGSGADAETWVWNGTTWTQRSVTGPSARFSAGAAWDPVRQRVVVFAGAIPGNGAAPRGPSGPAWACLRP